MTNLPSIAPCESVSCRSFLGWFEGQVCIESFVSKHGIQMPFDLNGTTPVFGRPHLCFQNCYELLLRQPSLTYCEGFAKWASSIPVLHAWMRDSNGKVYDPTWPVLTEEHASSREYFGVPLKREFVIQSIQRRKRYGIFDDWENKWPVTNEKRQAFFQT